MSASTTCRTPWPPSPWPRRWASTRRSIREALAGFGGVKRRFTRTGEVDGITVIDDYGHHPVEIARGADGRARRRRRRVDRRRPAAPLLAAAGPVRGVLHLLQRRRRGDRRRRLCGRRGADRGRRPARRWSQGLRAHGHRHVVPLDGPDELAGVVDGHRRARRHRGLPRRRQHHRTGRTPCPASSSALPAPGRRRDDGRRHARPPPDRPAAAGARPLRENVAAGAASPGSASAARPRCCSARPTRTTWPPSWPAAPADVPVTVIGVGSNLLVRDGGVPGVVVRLGRAFAEHRGRGRRRRAPAPARSTPTSRAPRRRPGSAAWSS